MLGVDGDEAAGTVTYSYGVFYADDEDDYPTPVREYVKVVKVKARTECGACNADQGEPCREWCIGHAAHLDEIGATL